MKWTRQRCQVAFSTLATAALMPSWASEMTSLTPRRPRRASLRRNSVQNVSASEGPTVHAQHLAPAVAVDAHRDDHRHRDDAPGLRAPSRRWRRSTDTASRPRSAGSRKAFTRSSISSHSRRDLALGDAAHAHGLDQVIDRAGRDALDVGLLDHRGQRLLGHPPRLQEAGEVAALAQLGDAQLDRAGPGLPVAVAVAVALHQPLGALLAMAGAGQRRRPPAPSAAGRRSRSSRAARSASGLFSMSARRSIISSVIGGPRLRLSSATQPYRRSSMTAAEAARSLRRHGSGALASGSATTELHHAPGHDRKVPVQYFQGQFPVLH